MQVGFAPVAVLEFEDGVVGAVKVGLEDGGAQVSSRVATKAGSRCRCAPCVSRADERGPIGRQFVDGPWSSHWCPSWNADRTSP